MFASVGNLKRYKLFSLIGFPVYVDVGFLFLLGFFLVIGYRAILPTMLLVLIVVASILWHELGHALAVRKFGYGNSTILLSAFGGLTIHTGHPPPRKSIVVSLAGPGVGLVLGGLFALLLFVIDVTNPWLYLLLFYLVWVNIVWSIFNLLPLHPLDGGQALRSILRLRMDEKSAVVKSATTSFGIAVVVAIFAVLYNYLFVAIIVGFLAYQNYRELKTWGSDPFSHVR